MRRPPPLSTCLGYPITAGVAALAIAATLRWWSGANIDRELAHLGYKALESNNPQLAVSLYEKAVRINPNVHDWWFNLAVAYQRLGRPDDALDAFKRAAALEPQHSEVNP